MLTNRLPTFLLLTIFLIACSSKNELMEIPSIYPSPKVVLLDTVKGYESNQFDGREIEPESDSIITGKWINIESKSMILDSVLTKSRTPLVVDTTSKSVPNRVHFTQPAATRIERDQLKKFKFGDAESDFKLVTAKGDTVSTGVVLPIQPSEHVAISPEPVYASQMEYSEGFNSAFNTLHLAQGLVSSEGINSIVVDEYGVLWIAHYEGGLTRFDGVQLINYTTFHGLSSNIITCMIKDRDGNLWCGTAGSGVLMFDGHSFWHYDQNSGFPLVDILSLYEDACGNIWVGDAFSGAARISKEGALIITEKEGLFSNQASSIIEYDGSILFGSGNNGMTEIRYENCEFGDVIHHASKNGSVGSTGTSVMKDSDGNIWYSAYNGAYCYMGDSVYYINQSNGLIGYGTSVIFEDSHKRIWYCSHGGISVKDGNDFYFITEKDGLFEDAITSMTEDDFGNFWFGSFNGGITKLSARVFDLLKFSSNRTNNYSLALTQDLTGGFWMSTWGYHGFKRYIPDTENYSFGQMDQLQNFFQINKFDSDLNGDVWLGTNMGGHFYRVKNDTLDTWSIFGKKEFLFNAAIGAIQSDPDSTVWLAEGGSVFNIWKEQGVEMLTQFSFGEAFNIFAANDEISCIAQSASGDLWMGNNRGDDRPSFGLVQLQINDDKNGGRFIKYSTKEGLSGNSVSTLFIDQDEHVWVGTDGGGINVFDGDVFTYITEREGLSNNFVKSIIGDDWGNIWVTTANGLNLIKRKNQDAKADTDRFDFNDFYIVQFGTRDGMEDVEFNEDCALFDSNKMLWFGARKGFLVLDPSIYADSILNVHAPQLRQLEINDRRIDFRNLGDSLAKFVAFDSVARFENYPINPDFHYTSNHLTFHFSSVNWLAPHKTKYSFRIVGLDNEWSQPTENTFADYRNLPPGEFTFEVAAIGESQEWSAPTRYQFTISPPWWATTWFSFLQAFFFTMLLVITYFASRHGAGPFTSALTMITIIVIFETLLVFISSYIEVFANGIPIVRFVLNVLLAICLKPIDRLVSRIFESRKR